jgi:hypothetical protein
MSSAPADGSRDDYPTCAGTHATLRIFSAQTTPEEISSRLGIEPTSSHRRGEPLVPRVTGSAAARLHGWFLSSEAHVRSRDLRRHLDWLLDAVEPAADALRELARTERADVFCLWQSASGHGGPTLSPTQLARLGALGLELGLDVYFPGDAPSAPRER